MGTSSYEATDVVIIGGGIVGASIAYELLQHGVRATLVDREEVAAGQSGRNWGFVRQQGRSPEELPLMRAANDRWQQLERETGESFDWVQGGNVALAVDDTGAARYREWTNLGRRYGVETRLIGHGQVQALVPGLKMPFTAAIYAAGDGHADPVGATSALARAAERGGVRILRGCSVKRIEQRGGRVTGVMTDRGRLNADTVICAAGTASRALLRTTGLRLPQNIVRGTVALTEPVPRLTKATVWAPGLAFRQRSDGRLVVSTGGGGEVDLTLDAVLQAPLFLPAFKHNHRRLRMRINGAVMRDIKQRVTGVIQDDEPKPTGARVQQSLFRLRRALPQLRQVRIERSWAGRIDSTPDALPVVDRVATPSGLVIATGFSGHGFGLAPAIGQVVAALATGAAPNFNLAPFRMSRFTERDFVAPDAIL